jgi:hypothetical protein
MFMQGASRRRTGPVAAVTSVLVARVLASAPTAARAESRTAEISGSVLMLDDEYGRDSRATETFSGSVKTLDTPFLTHVERDVRWCMSDAGARRCPSGLFAVPVYRLGGSDWPCAGDEVRIRLTITARTFLHSPGWIRADIDAELYEGTDCDTEDLDGRRRYQVWIVPHGSAKLDFRVRNTDEGGDYADFHFVVRNLA